MADITAAQVKELREKTGAGMMECKKVLQETGGDIEKGIELLRTRLGDKALKLGGRDAREGTVQSYIHSNAKVGVLVEVDCATDFVATNPEFVDFARAVAMHVAAVSTIHWVSADDVPQDKKDAETKIFQAQAADKPENIRPKIAEGRLRKWLEEVTLLDQQHVNADKYEGRTIEQIRAELSGKLQEPIVIKRFARFAVGG
ncbi:MAG: elongation factor Ts [Solirubrobacteraceae bacterium]|jgi:elongation factor Ts|nr:elongation factor Ts [Solirubrobacteraceae bacterium]